MMLFSLLLLVLFNIVNTKECPTRSSIEKSLADGHIPGVVVIVVNTTDILYQEAFGHQSFLPTRLMDAKESIFVLASISKTFIATAVMQLVESKLLALDEDINRYVLPSDRKISNPFYPTVQITLRQLLSHSASIGHNTELESYFFQTDDQALTETTLAEACFSFLNQNASNWLPYRPGTVTLYSNVGSALAALVVERVAKMSYEQYVREKILQPLGIDVRKAAFRLSDIEDHTNLVKHYAFDPSQYYQHNDLTPLLNITQSGIPNWLSFPFYSVSIYPAGLLRMSAHSLSIYLRMFMNNGSSVLRPESVVQMRTAVSGVIPYEYINMTNTESTPPTPEFGVSWYWRILENGRRYIGHDGSMPGAINTMIINEMGNLGLIMLTNADIYPDDDISIKISTSLSKIRMALLDCYE